MSLNWTITWVLKFAFLDLLCGLGVMAASIYYLGVWEPSPAHMKVSTLSDMLGQWPAVVGMVAGAAITIWAWHKGRSAKLGRG